ncbi:MAG: hypothetical protein RBS39_12630 [Phycisphaerales bacterium]|jgi:hypothetical protein|nr:hypothetical protein [Phycisphaerales bacterium]
MARKSIVLSTGLPLVALAAPLALAFGTSCYEQTWFNVTTTPVNPGDCYSFYQCPDRILCDYGDVNETTGFIFAGWIGCRTYIGGVTGPNGECIPGKDAVIVTPAHSVFIYKQNCFDDCP